MNLNRQRIALAVAQGQRTYRQLAATCGVAYSTVTHHLNVLLMQDIVTWQGGDKGTLRLGSKAVVVRHKGEIVEVMKGEVVENELGSS